MKKLEPPASHYLKAAQGWLELGNAPEAIAELQKVPEAWQKHPRVVHEWWHIRGHQKDYVQCLALSREMQELHPELSWGWFMQSWTLFCQGQLHAAYENLLLVADQFSKDKLIRYELACYACKLDLLQEARKWLAQAAELTPKAQLREKALKDPKLKPLWDWVQEWPVAASGQQVAETLSLNPLNSSSASRFEVPQDPG
jgi:tetratricopeptide (TPR) repeat protein